MQMDLEKIALLTLEAKHHKLEKTKLEAAVDAMKTLSPETKRQVAVELSAAKSCVATDPKASCELIADTGAPLRSQRVTWASPSELASSGPSSRIWASRSSRTPRK